MYFPSRMSSVVTDYSTPLNELVPPGVVTGDDLLVLLEHARANGYALPAVNCTRYVHVSLDYMVDTVPCIMLYML